METMTKRKPGRPTVCTAEKIRKILELVRRGYSLDDAAIETGIHPETFRLARRADPVLSDRAFRAHREFIAERATLLARARADTRKRRINRV